MFKNEKAERQSGVAGVHWDSSHNKWKAAISIQSKLMTIGYFVDLDSAISARKNADAIKEEVLSKTRSKPKSSMD